MLLTQEATTSKHFPRHIAIMMDGNGRWGTKRGLPRTAGHYAGMNTMRKMIRVCHHINLQYLTLYAFSSENWTRPQEEVDYLLKLPFKYFNHETLSELDRNNVQLRMIGDISKFSQELTEILLSVVDRTKNNSGMVVNIALNYGGRLDIINAIKKILREDKNPDDINEELIEKCLYTGGQPLPDLIIRTSGELRLSNFLLWQSATAELWFTKTLWPDFNESLLYEAINEYIARKRANL
jgi:undecaprenyl diphosphate synthase